MTQARRELQAIAELAARIDAARALHSRKATDGLPHYCSECLATEFPCPTIRALDGPT